MARKSCVKVGVKAMRFYGARCNLFLTQSIFNVSRRINLYLDIFYYLFCVCVTMHTVAFIRSCLHNKRTNIKKN